MSNSAKIKEAKKSAEDLLNGYRTERQKSLNNIKELEKKNAELNTKKNNLNKEIENLRSELEQEGDPENMQEINSEIKEKSDELGSTQEEMNKNASEIDINKESVSHTYAGEQSLGYNDEDLENLNELIKDMEMHEQNSASKYNISSVAGSTGTVHPDIRNLPGSINFRSYNSKYLAKLSKDAEKNTENNGPSLARVFYMNQDFLFTNSLASPIPLGKISHDNMPEIQPLIINEFQPYEALSTKDVMDIFAKVGNILEGSNFLKFFISAVKSIFTNSQIDRTYKNSQDLYLRKRAERRALFTADPVEVVKNMFGGGKWLNTYEIPYYGGDYLIGKYSGKWVVGNDGGEDFISNFFGADFPANPKFKITMGASRRDPITTTFYLINSNAEWMRRNFEFIQAIFAGTSWVHLRYCVLRPPNVYNVVCPGRFHFIYAAMDITVTFEGKLRRNPKFSASLRSMDIKSIDEDTLWPDAWKVAITIHDMTPNNFNMYANYYMNGFNIQEMAILSQKNDVINELKNLPDYFIELYEKDIIPGLEKAEESLKDAAKVMGQKLSEGYEKLKEKAPEAAAQVKEKAGQAYEKTKEAAGQGIEKLKEKAPEVAAQTKKAAGQVYEKTKEVAGQVYEKGKEAAGQVYEKTKEVAGQAKTQLVEKGKEVVGQAKTQLVEKGKQIVGKFNN